MTGSSIPGDLSGRYGAAPDGAVLFYGVMILLVSAPLFLGVWRPLPLMIMELGAVALMGGLVYPGASSPGGAPPSLPIRIFLLLLFLLPVAQLVPVPAALWAELPGRAFYAGAMRLAGDGFDWRATSLIPAATEAAWLTLLPPLAVFLVAVRLSPERLLALVMVFLAIAALEALLGLIQYGHSMMRESASGTYRNRNHLAGLLEMALPVGLALLAATVGHRRPEHTGGRHGKRTFTVRQWLARLSVTRVNHAAAFGAMSIAILLGLIFTRSRTGLGLAMVGIILSTLLFSYRLGGRNAYGLIGTFTAGGIGLASLIGLTPILTRFAFSDPFEDGRWKIFDATLQAIGEFFPLGSGAGTFLEVLRRFHPATFPGYTINRAHNDYLEWMLEFGLVAGLLIAFWLLVYFRQWTRVWRRAEWAPFRFAQAGAGIALLLMMLHTLTDYNLRIPANAVFAAFLAAVFFHRPPKGQARRGRHRESPGAHDSRPPPVLAIPRENQINPFGT